MQNLSLNEKCFSLYCAREAILSRQHVVWTPIYVTALAVERSEILNCLLSYLECFGFVPRHGSDCSKTHDRETTRPSSLDLIPSGVLADP